MEVSVRSAIIRSVGTALAIQSGTEGCHTADEILYQIFLAILGQINDLNLAILHLQQLFYIVIAKTSQTVFVLHNDQRDSWIVQQLQ